VSTCVYVCVCACACAAGESESYICTQHHDTYPNNNRTTSLDTRQVPMMRDKAGVVQCVVCGPARAAPDPVPTAAPAPAPVVVDTVDMSDDDDFVSSYESRRRDQMMAVPRTAAAPAAARGPLSTAHACAIRAIEARIEAAAAELAVSGGMTLLFFSLLSLFFPFPVHPVSQPPSPRIHTCSHAHVLCFTHIRRGALHRHSTAADPAGRRRDVPSRLGGMHWPCWRWYWRWCAGG